MKSFSQSSVSARISRGRIRVNFRAGWRHGLMGWLCMSLVACVALRGAEGDAMISGLVEPFLDVSLSTSVSGIVMVRKVKEGSFVTAGETLLELDKHLEELEVDRRKLVAEARRIDFEGTEKLFKNTRGTSKEEFEKKEYEFKLAQVEHAQALEQLNRRILVAPLSGVIVSMPVEVGESCQPYQPLARVVDLRKCYFVIHVESETAAGLKAGQEVRVMIETVGGPQPVLGNIHFVSPVVDPASGLIRVKVLFDNPEGKIRPGLAGRMELKK